MDKERVRRSIAHGCFRSLAAFVEARTDPATSATFQRKFARGEFGPLERRQKPAGPRECPYFSFADGPVQCPFDQKDMADEVRSIRSTCAKDKVHIGLMTPPRSKP